MVVINILAMDSQNSNHGSDDILLKPLAFAVKSKFFKTPFPTLWILY